MSVSLKSARTRTFVRSAILSRIVPPLALFVADAMTWPNETGFSMMVPATGAETTASSTRCFAMSTVDRERISAATELA